MSIHPIPSDQVVIGLSYNIGDKAVDSHIAIPVNEQHAGSLEGVDVNPNPQQEEGWGAWLYNQVAWAGTKVAKNGYYAATRFNVRDVRKKTEQNLVKIRNLTGYPHLSKTLELLLPQVGELAFKMIQSQGRFQQLVEQERGDIRELVNGAIVQLVANWTEHTAEKNPDSKDLTVDMVRVAIEAVNKHLPRIQERLQAHGSMKFVDNNKRHDILNPLVDELNAIFLPNGRADIHAPYPVNQILYSTIQDMLYSEEFLNYFLPFEVKESVDTLEKSKDGKLFLELFPKLMKKMPEPKLPGKETIQKQMGALLPKDHPMASILSQWIANRYDGLMKNDLLGSLMSLTVSFGEDMILKTAAEVVSKNKGSQIAELIINFAINNAEELKKISSIENVDERAFKANELFGPMSKELFKLLGWSEPKSLHDSKLFESAILGLIQTQVTQLLADMFVGEQAWSEILTWQAQKNQIQESLGAAGTAVAQKMAKKTVNVIFAIAHTKPAAFVEGETQSQAVAALVDPNNRSANVIAKGVTDYLEGVFLKVMQCFIDTVKKKEKADPAFNEKVTVELMTVLKRYFMVKNRRPTIQANAPEFQEMGESLIKVVGITKESLPVSPHMKEKIWKMLIEKTIPDMLDNTYKSFLNKEYLEKKLVATLKMNGSGNNHPQAAGKPVRNHDAINQAAGELAMELGTFFEIPLLDKIDPKALGALMGGMITQQLQQNPISKMIEDVLNYNANVNYDVYPSKKEYDPQELPRVLGEKVKKDVRTAISSAITARWKAFQKVFNEAVSNNLGTPALHMKKSLDIIFNALGTTLWYTLGYVPYLFIMMLVDLYLQKKVDGGVEKAREELDFDLVTRLMATTAAELTTLPEAIRAG